MTVLVHIADKVLNRPLLLHPDKLAVIASILDGRIGIDATEFKELDVDARFTTSSPDASRFIGSSLGPDKTRKPYNVEKGVAVIQIIGSLVNRGAWLGSYSGMTSYEGIGFQLESAAKDADVTTVILDIDSPGGEAVGAFEAADKVRALAKSKNVVAVVNGMSASAAYAIAAAANQIVSTPSGVSGSVGVVLLHADYSEQLRQKGIRPTLIHAGAHKVDGNPYQPLTETVRADLKAEVDQFYDLFVSSVAKGRKGRMTDKAIRSTEARTYIGQAAVDVGLVDAIGSLETVLADLSRGRKPNPGVDGLHGVTSAQMQKPDPAVVAAQEAARARQAHEAAQRQKAADEAAARKKQEAITQSWIDVAADVNRRMRGP